MTTSKKTLLLFLLILIIHGCSKYHNTWGINSSAGIYIYPEKLQNIKKGLYQTEVFNILGSPTFVNSFNKNIWYYIYQKTWYIAILDEKLIDQQILILYFNTDGILNHIESKTLNDTHMFKFDNSITNFYYKRKYIKPDLFN